MLKLRHGSSLSQELLMDPDILSEIASRKVSVRTVKNYRSAIAYYWKSIIGYEIPENDQVLSGLFRGFKRERPMPFRHVVQWVILLVLKFLQSPRFRNASSTSDKDITLKAVFLLAMS